MTAYEVGMFSSESLFGTCMIPDSSVWWGPVLCSDKIDIEAHFMPMELLTGDLQSFWDALRASRDYL